MFPKHKSHWPPQPSPCTPDTLWEGPSIFKVTSSFSLNYLKSIATWGKVLWGQWTLGPKGLLLAQGLPPQDWGPWEPSLAPTQYTTAVLQKRCLFQHWLHQLHLRCGFFPHTAVVEAQLLKKDYKHFVNTKCLIIVHPMKSFWRQQQWWQCLFWFSFSDDTYWWW